MRVIVYLVLTALWFSGWLCWAVGWWPGVWVAAGGLAWLALELAWRRSLNKKGVPDYRIPRRIVLDDESWARISADLNSQPAEPTAALRELFKKDKNQ